MLRSMTGFGRCFLEEEDWTQVWEIRSVNGRHLDVRWRLPAQARALEPVLEKQVKAAASRGRLEISLFLQLRRHSGADAGFNEERADSMLQAVARFAASRGDAYAPDYNRLLALSALWEEGPQDEDDALHESLERGLASALEDWNESRSLEGAALEKDLLRRILRMEEWLLRIRERAPFIKEERFAQVRERLGEVLERYGQELDESRFLQEIALMADKLDVSEELTRLAVHFDRLRELLAQGKETGRKLDFTLQECFREISTCGNKIQDAQVARLVVDVKNEMEKCREQVQNVE
ncbi:YicC family protein [Desulfovibrio sp. OttesenSCG-928-G11]|nr:YicC family protein [Desulfovibrio sp. OttesenSCG-928-G11]